MATMHELLHCRFMREGDPVRLRALAKDCLEQGNKARTAVDQDAWLQLAEDFIKLATTLEQPHAPDYGYQAAEEHLISRFRAG
jgi:hypothetical protein